jgi:phosphogluconate dehydratase
LPFQGPKQNGMPELHKLTPTLSVLQTRGYKVALVTDGRMSGASGKVPAAIHLTPEAKDGGIIAKIRTGDLIRLNAITGELSCLNFPIVDSREVSTKDNSSTFGYGRELFINMRNLVTSSEEGASFL